MSSSVVVLVAGAVVVVGAGVGGQGGDDAGGGVGDGDDDGCLLDLGPVDALDVERGGDDLLQRADAAGYLGYDKADSFRRARTRRAIAGETRTSDGRPAWTPAALRAWHARHPIAGNRTAGHDPTESLAPSPAATVGMRGKGGYRPRSRVRLGL